MTLPVENQQTVEAALNCDLAADRLSQLSLLTEATG